MLSLLLAVLGVSPHLRPTVIAILARSKTLSIHALTCEGPWLKTESCVPKALRLVLGDEWQRTWTGVSSTDTE